MIDLTPYNLDRLHVYFNRKHQFIMLTTYADRAFGLTHDPDDFVKWCRGNGVKLHTIGFAVFKPAFRDEVARDAFRTQWMTEANLGPGIERVAR